MKVLLNIIILLVCIGCNSQSKDVVIYISGKGAVPVENTVTTVPRDLSYAQNSVFEYREPYFPDNYDVEFRKWYRTHTMEDTWAMWGHNLNKVVASSAQMMAKVNGRINEEQFCFSSPELEAALIAYINRMTIDEPLRSKFMVQPNDNNIVCQCDKCKDAGNTKTDASPAVFGLLNKLAAKFPKQEFFSSAYITTMHPPKFKLADNAGVMISTMAFPKGVIIEQSGKKAMVDKIFDNWQKVTGRIYLWDYAINFDNYFKTYPTLMIAKQNLKYYKDKGVKGVFMQGSEDQYSAFGDLKNYIYALLLNNMDIDIKNEIKLFFKAKYPAIADLLTDYYLKIEQRSFDKKVPLDIYGGMEQSKKKYLDEVEFNMFYETLISKSETLTANELKDIKPLLLSFTFIKMELLRTNGIGESGYKPAPDTPINKEVDVLFRRLFELSQQTGIKTYSETGLRIQDYLEQWNTDIIQKKYGNLLFGKKVGLAFTPDEGYDNPKTLTDGAIGFNDYYNNWMICTLEPLALDITASDVMGAKTVEMDFLQDVKHNIYLPQKVEVLVDGKVFGAYLKSDTGDEVSKIHVTVPVDIGPTVKTVQIRTTKRAEFKNKSIACDEVFFKK